MAKQFFFLRGDDLIYFLFKGLFQLSDFFFKEEELSNEGLEGMFIAGVTDTDRVFSKSFEVCSGEGGFFTSGGGSLIDDSLNLVGLGFFDEWSRGEFYEDGEESFREGVKFSDEFWEEDLEGLEDLGFSFSDFLGEGLNGSGDGFRVIRDGGEVKEFWIFEGEECKEGSIFGVGLSGGGSVEEFMELVSEFRVNDEGREVIGEEEGGECEVISTGGFQEYSGRGVILESGKEILVALCGLRELFDEEWFSVLIDDTDSEVILRDINAYIVVHSTTSLWVDFGFRFVPYSILPFGEGFEAQPTYWELRDRGTDSFWGFIAQEKWSPCPSLFRGGHSYIIN